MRLALTIETTGDFGYVLFLQDQLSQVLFWAEVASLLGCLAFLCSFPPLLAFLQGFSVGVRFPMSIPGPAEKKKIETNFFL